MSKLLIAATISETLGAFLLPFVRYFQAQGWQVDGMACGISHSADCLAHFNQVWDVSWSRSPLDPQNLLIAPRQIQAVVAQENYDLVHVHTPVAAFVTRYALKRWQKQGTPKLIYTAHGFNFHRQGHPLRNTLFLALEKLAGNWTDYLVVINREDEAASHQYRIVPADRVCYMPGIGVDLQQFCTDRISHAQVLRLYQELELSTDTPLLLSIAELIPRKRPQDLLQALARLARPEVHLIWAGGGVLQAAMQQLAVDLGIQSQVHFLGFRSDIPTLIRAATVTVLTSAQEGLPRSIMESLCLETPVIGTDIRGVRELVGPEQGRLVPVGDIANLTEALVWMLDHPVEAQRMGQQGRLKMAAYDLQQVLSLHTTLYQRALAS